MLNVGGPELLIILLVALVFLGPQRLPELARQMGQAVSSLRSLASGFQAELEAASRPDPDTSMTLKGPTTQSDAIAQTQTSESRSEADMKPQSDRTQGAADSGNGTNPASIAKAARDVEYDNEPPVSSGGPTNLAEMAAVSRGESTSPSTDGSVDAAAEDDASSPVADDDSNDGATAPDNTAEKSGAAE